MKILTGITELTTDSIDKESLSDIWNKISGLSILGVVKIITLVIVLAILIRLILSLTNKLLARSHIEPTVHGFIRSMVRVGLYFVAVVIVCGSLGINTASLIAVLSVAGLALSLAMQGALSNLAGGMVLLMTKPFHVGDYVEIGGHEGFVQEINMTYTQIVTYQHLKISIPNSNVTSADIVNYSVEGRRRVDLVVSAGYDCPIEAVKQALVQAVRAVPQLAESDEIFARVSGYQDSCIEYTVRAWCDNADYWDAYFNLMERIKYSFEENGVMMTYPHLHVHMEGRH